MPLENALGKNTWNTQTIFSGNPSGTKFWFFWQVFDNSTKASLRAVNSHLGISKSTGRRVWEKKSLSDALGQSTWKHALGKKAFEKSTWKYALEKTRGKMHLEKCTWKKHEGKCTWKNVCYFTQVDLMVHHSRNSPEKQWAEVGHVFLWNVLCYLLSTYSRKSTHSKAPRGFSRCSCGR